MQCRLRYILLNVLTARERCRMSYSTRPEIFQQRRCIERPSEKDYCSMSSWKVESTNRNSGTGSGIVQLLPRTVGGFPRSVSSLYRSTPSKRPMEAFNCTCIYRQTRSPLSTTGQSFFSGQQSTVNVWSASDQLDMDVLISAATRLKPPFPVPWLLLE